jgi:hypothetical protein
MTRAIEPSPKKPTRYEPVLNEIEIAFGNLENIFSRIFPA